MPESPATVGEEGGAASRGKPIRIHGSPLVKFLVSIDGHDFYIDLLFFNWAQSRFVVVELKIGRFEPEYAGKLGFYVAWADANLRIPDRHSPTIGILLCAGRNDNVVRYSLAGTTAPLAVADYTYDSLPPDARQAVPTDSERTAAVLDQLMQHAPGSSPDADGRTAAPEP